MGEGEAQINKSKKYLDSPALCYCIGYSWPRLSLLGGGERASYDTPGIYGYCNVNPFIYQSFIYWRWIKVKKCSARWPSVGIDLKRREMFGFLGWDVDSGVLLTNSKFIPWCQSRPHQPLQGLYTDRLVHCVNTYNPFKHVCPHLNHWIHAHPYSCSLPGTRSSN